VRLKLSEICKTASEFDSVADRVLFLQKHQSPALVSLLKHMFDPNIKFVLPEGEPPYIPTSFDARLFLYSEVRRFYLFTVGGHNGLTDMKRQKLFVELLESIDPEDAKLVVAMVNKTSPFKGLTRNVVSKAFPGLI
jgi:hypothetical protein